MLSRVFLCVVLMGALLPLGASIAISLGGIPCTTAQGFAGQCTPYYSASTVTFDGLAAPNPAPSNPYTSGAATYSWTPTSSRPLRPFVHGSSSGNFATPPLDVTDYLTVGSPSRPMGVNITFSSPMNYFGFYMGSPDLYNHVTIKVSDGGGTLATLSGADFLLGTSQNWSTGGFVNIRSTDLFTRVEMFSTTDNNGPIAFETDNHAYGVVPEPTSIILLGTCMLGVAGIIRRRRAS